MHIEGAASQGELPVVLQHDYSDPGQLQDASGLAGCWTSLILGPYS